MTSSTRTPHTSDRRRTDTRERIVRAAVGLFADGGFTATSVADIERAVGLTPGAGGLYRHFKSKDDLLLTAVETYRDRVRALRERFEHEWALGPAVAARASARARRSAVERDLRHVLDAFLELLSNEAGVVRLSLEGPRLPSGVRTVLGESWDHAYALVAGLFVRHGMPEPRARPSAVLALGSLHHYAEQLAGWGRVPGGVPAGDLVDEWVHQWTDLVCASPSRSGRASE